MKTCEVSSVQELLTAVGDPEMRTIKVAANLKEVPSFRLAPSQVLCGPRDSDLHLYFSAGVDGLCLSREACDKER